MKNLKKPTERSSTRTKIDKLLSRYRDIKASIVTFKAAEEKSKQEAVYCAEALEHLRTLVQGVQESTHTQIASIVERCLSAVFDDSYRFQIRIEKKRGKTEANMLFLREGHEYSAEAIGGGVVDVASFALRLAAILLHRPPVRRLMVMDEPFKFVARDVLPKIALLMDTLAEELNFQFIVITHIPELMCGQIYELE